jgi:hypothetical protein
VIIVKYQIQAEYVSLQTLTGGFGQLRVRKNRDSSFGPLQIELIAPTDPDRKLYDFDQYAIPEYV